MYVQKGNGFLVDFSLRQIGKKYDEEKNVKAKIRLQCALLRKKGRVNLTFPKLRDCL